VILVEDDAQAVLQRELRVRHRDAGGRRPRLIARRRLQQEQNDERQYNHGGSLTQIMFSSRVPLDRTPNRLHQTLERLRAAGAPLIDLTLSNPTLAGIAYPADVLAELASNDGLRYEPSPLGLPSARDAIARSLNVPADRVLLTASTSDAYSVLFKLLCDPGDAVLVPQPSYPLFELLAPLEGVKAVPYPLDSHAGWTIDVDAIRAAAEAIRQRDDLKHRLVAGEEAIRERDGMTALLVDQTELQVGEVFEQPVAELSRFINGLT
jgi:DNA-binding transcriptional MocR family regulator